MYLNLHVKENERSGTVYFCLGFFCCLFGFFNVINLQIWIFIANWNLKSQFLSWAHKKIMKLIPFSGRLNLIAKYFLLFTAPQDI